MSDATTLSRPGWRRVSRWDVAALWRIASMWPARSRLGRLVLAWLRPPLLTGDAMVTTMVASPVAGRGGLFGVVTLGLLLAVSAGLAPAGWVSVLIVVLGLGGLVAFVERVAMSAAVPSGHARWSDVRGADSRMKGAGEAALRSLLRDDHRPAVLEVDESADGLVRMYRRLGFAETGRTVRRRRGGVVVMEMTRAGDESAPAPSIGAEPTDWELVAAAVAGLLVAALVGFEDPRASAVVASVVVFVLAGLADWRVLRISNSVLGAGGLVVLAVAYEVGDWSGALGGALAAGAPLLAMNLATRGRSPGMGDVKLVAFGGAVVGIFSITAAVVAVLVGLLAGGVFGVVYESLMKRRGFPLGVPLASVFAVVLLAQVVSQRSWS